MKTQKKEEIEKEEKKRVQKITKQNERIIKKNAQTRAKRHVKVKDEPVLKRLLDDFQDDYAKNVASKSAIEIIKLVKSDEFYLPPDTTNIKPD